MFDFLDKTGIKFLLEFVKSKLSGKSDSGHTHSKADITDFPASLPANGGNADTVDGLRADDFVKSFDQQFDLPSNVDVPTWILQNANYYTRYRTHAAIAGLTNVPNNANHDWVWYWFDGVNIIAREFATGKYYICDVINGDFSGWKDVYTSGFKPYVTGSTTTATNTVTTNHGFTPSAVFYWVPSQGSWFCGSATFDTTSFQISFPPSESIVVNYLIFR